MDIFTGTAKYYDAFRPGITNEVRDFVLGVLKSPTALLDLGTGTGRVLAQFVPYFRDVIAVEPNHDMAKLARRRLEGFPVNVLEVDAEHAELPPGWLASLVTIVRAFHWMDRQVVLERLESIVEPYGSIAVISDRSFWHVDEPWAETIRRVIADFLGPERLTTQGQYQRPPRNYADDFAASVFSQVHRKLLPVTRHWTADQIVGYLYSTSFSAPPLLGGRVIQFENELRRKLEAVSLDNSFVEHNEFEIWIAKRP